VDQLGDVIWQMRGYAFVGAVILGAGLAVLLAGRAAGAESARTIRWISWPLLGCGGCLIALPLFVVFSLLVMGYGVASFCQQTAGC